MLQGLAWPQLDAPNPPRMGHQSKGAAAALSSSPHGQRRQLILACRVLIPAPWLRRLQHPIRTRMFKAFDDPTQSVHVRRHGECNDRIMRIIHSHTDQNV